MTHRHHGRPRLHAAPDTDGPQPRGAARAGLPRRCRARARARPRTSSSGRWPRSASGSASPRRWATPCSPTSPRRSLPGVDVVFLDTGYHFAETIGTARRRRRDHAGQPDHRSRRCRPSPSRTPTYGKDLFKRDPDLCCALRKVQPLAEALAGVRRLGDRAAPRRDPQPRDRAGRRLGRQASGKVKVSPLARWTDEDVEQYIDRARRAGQPARVRRLPVDRLRAVHAPRRPGRGPAQRPLGRHRQDRVRDPLMTPTRPRT